MYTSQTKLLFNQLPESLVFDQDHKLWTRPLEWQSQPFKPTGGAKNLAYLKGRAFSVIEQLPKYLTYAFGGLDPERLELFQPRGTSLHIMPRLFECQVCRRLRRFQDAQTSDSHDDRFSRGFYCFHCKASKPFQQVHLVWVHNCGYIGTSLITQCPRHGWNDLHLDRKRGRRLAEWQIRCIGSGSVEHPACNEHEMTLIPAYHSQKSCPNAKFIQANFKEPAALEFADQLNKKGIRPRPGQDPANFSPVGIDVVNPSLEVPPNVHANMDTVGKLLDAHIRGLRLQDEELETAFKAAKKTTDQLQKIRSLLAEYDQPYIQGVVQSSPEQVRAAIWKGMVGAAGLDGQVAPTPDDTRRLLTSGDRATLATPEILVDRKRAVDDTSHLVDQLIEISHLNSSASKFRGLDETKQELEEYERESRHQFVRGAALARNLAFSDIRVGDAFEIVRIQVGYIRNTYDVKEALLQPFRESGQERIPFYARQSSTEAVLFQVDPVRLIQWVHREWPRADFLHVANMSEVSPEEARSWLLRNIDFAACQGFEPISHLPSGPAYQLLHTMSHLFMQTSGVFSGIDPSALKEIIFPGMPGFLIYQNQHGDFTMGGLTTLYEEHLESWLTAVQGLAQNCTNDPICRNGRMRDHPRAASCYACLTGSEIGCAHFNRDLDRNTLAGTPPAMREPKFRGFWEPIT